MSDNIQSLREQLREKEKNRSVTEKQLSELVLSADPDNLELFREKRRLENEIAALRTQREEQSRRDASATLVTELELDPETLSIR